DQFRQFRETLLKAPFASTVFARAGNYMTVDLGTRISAEFIDAQGRILSTQYLNRSQPMAIVIFHQFWQGMSQELPVLPPKVDNASWSESGSQRAASGGIMPVRATARDRRGRCNWRRIWCA